MWVAINDKDPRWRVAFGNEVDAERFAAQAATENWRVRSVDDPELASITGRTRSVDG